MADDESKRDELVVMRLIGEGKNRMEELNNSLDWTRDRVERTVDDLKEHRYVKTVSDGGDQVFKVTEKGVNEIPKLARDVADDTREFVDNVLDTFRTHFDRVVPDIDIDVTVRNTDED